MFLGLNEKAWAGINIVIFGRTPILPMKIEQAIAAASPANEVRVDSFEDYDQAYDFCKAQKNIGLIFVCENSGEVLAADIFKQLGTHYESKGWPCFGVLLHEKEKSMMGYLSLQKNKNLISYISVDDLMNSEKTFSTLNEVWNLFVSAFENTLIPEKLQETLLSLAEPGLSTESYNFRNRISTLLTQNLNISWLDAVAVKWQPVISTLKKINKNALTPNAALVQIADMAAPHEKVKDLFNVINLKTNLSSRLTTVVQLLDEARMNHKLLEVLENLKSKSQPGASALLRHLVGAQDGVLSIATDYDHKTVGHVG
jgi:hypothetical protein